MRALTQSVAASPAASIPGVQVRTTHYHNVGRLPAGLAPVAGVDAIDL